VGAVLSGALALYRAHFGRLVLISAIFVVPSNILFLRLAGAPLAAVFSTVAARSLAMLAIASLAWCVMAGQPASLKHSFQLAWSKLPLYLGIAVGQYLLGVLINSPGVALSALTPQAPLWCLGIPLNAATILLYLYIMVRWSVTTPVVLAEPGGVVRVLKRSWGLTRDHVWHCLAMWIGLALMYVLTVVLRLPASQWLGWTAGQVVMMVSDVLLGPLFGIAPVILYTELLARQPSPATVEGEPPPAPQAPVAA
jgi:hypothetical protein